MRTVLRSLLAVMLLAFGVAGAWAQSAPVTPVVSRSMWTVIGQGIEWPAYFILAGSLFIIALIVEHFIAVRLVTIVPPSQVRKARQLIERRNFRECLDRVRKSSTFFARVMATALQHSRHGFDAMHEAALEKSGELSGQMFRKVEYMNIIGNLGPLMGLLGTVYGMIIAFNSLGAGGGAAGTDAGGLAIGISLALVNTLLGLGLAIIGLGFFGFCRNRVDSLTVLATVQVLDLLEYFRPVPTGTPGIDLQRSYLAPTSSVGKPSTPPAATEPGRQEPSGL